MKRECNVYIHSETCEELSATEFNSFVRSEAERQYEELTGNSFNDLNLSEREECVLDQYRHQIYERGWDCYNRGVKIK